MSKEKEIKKKIIKDWEKEFDGKFVDWNSPSQFALYYEGTKKVTPDAIKSFIRQLLAQEKQKWVKEILKKIKEKETDPIFWEGDIGRARDNGYHQALSEIIKIIKEI